MTSDWLILSAIFKPIEQLCWHSVAGDVSTSRTHFFFWKTWLFLLFRFEEGKAIVIAWYLISAYPEKLLLVKCFCSRKSCFWNSSRIHVTNVTVESFAKTNTVEWLAVFGGVTWEVSKVIVKQEISLVDETYISQICRPYGAAAIKLTNKADFSLQNSAVSFTGRQLFIVYTFSRYTDSRFDMHTI